MCKNNKCILHEHQHPTPDTPVIIYCVVNNEQKYTPIAATTPRQFKETICNTCRIIHS